MTLLQHPPLPLAPVVPPKNLPKLAHQLCISKEIPCFTNEACSIDKLLGEEIHELQKLVIGVSVPQRTLDAVKEMCIVWWDEGGRGGLDSPSAESARVLFLLQTGRTRLNRRNTQKQAQATKRASLVAATRIFNGTDGAPRIVVIIPLSEDIDARACIQALGRCIDEEIYGINESTNIWTMKTSRFKTSLQFLPVPFARQFAALDVARAADYTLLLLSPTIEATPAGDTLLRKLQAQGLPTAIAAILPTITEDLEAKARPVVPISLVSFIQYFDPAQRRVFDLSAPADSLNTLRALADGCPGEVKWCAGRPWVVGESMEREESGVLKVTGVIRGGRLSPDRLVPIPNHGDYLVSKPIGRTALNLDREWVTAFKKPVADITPPSSTIYDGAFDPDSCRHV
ncbi:hypothetical protein EDD22DRAFT_1005392 [Suillus occidentalis]|nr:hypothetical protein EDD22DRAFT_1005392 [Suillus occidentalis]